MCVIFSFCLGFSRGSCWGVCFLFYFSHWFCWLGGFVVFCFCVVFIWFALIGVFTLCWVFFRLALCVVFFFSALVFVCFCFRWCFCVVFCFCVGLFSVFFFW